MSDIRTDQNTISQDTSWQKSQDTTHHDYNTIDAIDISPPQLSWSLASISSDLDQPPNTPAKDGAAGAHPAVAGIDDDYTPTKVPPSLKVDADLGAAAQLNHARQRQQQQADRRIASTGSMLESRDGNPTQSMLSPASLRRGSNEGAGSISATFANARSRPISQAGTLPFTRSNTFNSNPSSVSPAYAHIRGSSAPGAGIVNASSYDSMPWSPAVEFLSGFASATAPSPKPDDEGEQVGEYVLGKVIGHGGFSIVKEALTMSGSGQTEQVAVKIVPRGKDNEESERVYQLLDRELAIWKHLDHPNILPMLSVVETDFGMFIFMMLCPGGNLLDFLNKRKQGLDIKEVRKIFKQIAEATRYLHEDAKVVHKDLKLENCLLDPQGNWRVADFGLTEAQQLQSAAHVLQRHHSVHQVPTPGSSPLLSPPQTSPVEISVGGSLAYAAPEVLRSPIGINDPSTDMWALGVILYALLCNRLPFSDTYTPRLQMRIIKGQYEMPPCLEGVKKKNPNAFFVPEDDDDDDTHDPVTRQLLTLVKNCLEGLLCVKIESRWTIRQLIESPFLQS